MALNIKLRSRDDERHSAAERKRFMAAIKRIQAEFAAAPVLDPRSPAEIMDEMDEDILASH